MTKLATLNEVFSSASVRRRYEVWFLRIGLADGSGAWWLRYLLMNPGRGGCAGQTSGMPVQVWATWFPAAGKAQSWIQGFPLQALRISEKGQSPFRFQVGDNSIEEKSCKGSMHVDGHAISWDLRYQSTFKATLSSKGWIGFSRTPHSDAVFAGKITLDGRCVEGDPVGFGVQGHNCGYRHRNFWRWTHAHFDEAGKRASTFEALAYEMPFGLTFRRAVLWHNGQEYWFRNVQEASRSREALQWNFRCDARDGVRLEAAIEGRGPGVHHLPYTKTNCSGSFEVVNNSLASATIVIEGADGRFERLATKTGAVLEMVG